MAAFSKLALLLLIAGCLVLGCGDRTMVGDRAAGMTIRASATRIFSGETVTLFANTRNTLGKDARIDWHSSGGKLSPEENGQRARVMFDEPGTYRVDATLIVDGHEVTRDFVTIVVKALS